MQYAIVKKTDLNSTFRIDAEHYSPRFTNILNQLWQMDTRSIKDFLKIPVKTGHTPSKSIEKFYKDGNIKFIKTDNLRDGYIDLNEVDLLSEEGNQDIKSSELKPDDIIVTIIGATEKIVGRAARIYEDIGQANINQNVALLRTSLPAGFLTSFLNSKYGKYQLWWLSRQTEQVNLNCREVELIEIPVFRDNFTMLIHSINGHQKIAENNSKRLYQEAEELLLKEANLLDWRPKHNLWNVKKFSEIQEAVRIDAEYYQPKYDEIIDVIKQYDNGWNVLGSLINIKDKNFNPENEKTYKYLELSNISNSGEITGFTEEKGGDLPTRARRIVKTGDLIISSIEGSLESIALVTEQYNNALCSNGFYVVNSDFYNSETLFCLMKTFVGQQQLKKGCNGTILTAINKDEFSKIVLPKIKNNIQKEIKSKISEAYKLKLQSKQLLEIAKLGVEKAIEENEEIATNWINQELKKIGVSL